MREAAWRHRRDGEILDVAGERDSARRRSEADVDELLDVDRPMEVGGLRNGRRNRHASGVDRLPSIMAIDATSHFANQYGSQTLASNFLVDTQEVDLRWKYAKRIVHPPFG